MRFLIQRYFWQNLHYVFFFVVSFCFCLFVFLSGRVPPHRFGDLRSVFYWGCRSVSNENNNESQLWAYVLNNLLLIIFAFISSEWDLFIIKRFEAVRTMTRQCKNLDLLLLSDFITKFQIGYYYYYYYCCYYYYYYYCRCCCCATCTTAFALTLQFKCLHCLSISKPSGETRTTYRRLLVIDSNVANEYWKILADKAGWRYLFAVYNPWSLTVTATSDGWLGGRGVRVLTFYHLLGTPSPPEWLCIKAGSCVSHFNVSLIVWAKSQVVVVAFSSLARILGECSTIYSPSALFFLFVCLFVRVEISSRTWIPLFMPGSVHSGSVSWDDRGRMFPDKLRASLLPERFPHYAQTAA